MTAKIVDYSFINLSKVSNPNGSYKATVKGCSAVSGPGVTNMGNYPKAFHFSNGCVSCDISGADINFSKFTIKMMVRVSSKVNERQNLAESTHLPFSVYLDKDPEGGDFIVHGLVDTKSQNWGGVSTRFRKSLVKNKWYEICLAYDTNTIGLFADGSMVGIWAFPDGIIEKKTGSLLVIGAWIDKHRNPFKGDIAGFQWMDDIPSNYEIAIDNARDDAAWHISYKYESIKTKQFLGNEISPLRNDSVSGNIIQEFQHGWMLFNFNVGAFEIHGQILNRYKVLPATKRKALGWLVSDEIDGEVNQSKKSLFRGGAIYWSPWTPARAVYNQMYLDYETLGEGSSAIGLPTHSPTYVSGGMYQNFQYGRMYYKYGEPKAFEVHGSILQRYNSLGHYGSILGWPISNESDVFKNEVVVGKSSEFERGVIYWKSGIGAYEVHGDIGDKYHGYGGPAGPLGFPKTNESEIPNHPGLGKYSVFQGGVIVWYGSIQQTYICPPFKIQFQRIETTDRDPWPKGENDIYMHLYVYRNNALVFHVRKPNSGDYGGHNTKTLNYTIPNQFFPDNYNTEFKFRCRAKDADYDSADDLLGDLTSALNIHNAWGQRDGCVYARQSIQHMKITWSVLPQFDESQYSERDWNFWGTGNFKTSKLSWDQYAAAFKDVTGDPDKSDHLISPLDYLFFKAVVEGIAKNGNCFGLSLEAIYAQKHKSLYNGPLNRYKLDDITNEVNIKQAYQVGANAIWWFVSQFISGNTHDPKDVYNMGKKFAKSGNRPIYCITQKYFFTGAPHAILPWKWDTPSPWKIQIFDPNSATDITTLSINSSANTFSYNYGNSYTGGAWSGGRFYLYPWLALNSVQRTPIGDAILLLLEGSIIILGDSAETTSLTDTNGKNINGAHLMSTDSPRSKFFVPFHGLNGNVDGEFFLRKGSAVGNSYMHKVRGKKNGNIQYGIKNLSTGIQVETPVQLNEYLDLNVHNLGLSSNSLGLKSVKDKTFKIQYENYLGNVEDRITVIMENIKSSANQELKIIPKTGLAGVEIEGMKGTEKPKITIETRIDRKINKQVFNIDPGKAIRLDFSRVPFNSELKVANLDRIGGTINNIRNFRPL